MKTQSVLSWLFLVLLLCQTTFHSRALTPHPHAHIANSKIGKLIFISIPKSGTNMLRKLFNSFEIPGISYDFTTPYILRPGRRAINDKYPPHHYTGPYDIATNGPLDQTVVKSIARCRYKRSFSTHWPYTPEFEKLIEQTCTTHFFLIRDPRDQVVSMAHMIQKGYDAGQEIALEPLLLDLIDGRQQNFILWGVEKHGTYPLIWEKGIVEFYKLYLPWMNSPKFYTIHFEKLVGPQGGGSREEQIQEILHIAFHMKHPLSEQQAEQLADTLFGDTRTFREGQIGSWKKHFTPEMKAAFKAAGGDELLIRLGYETTKDW